MRLSPQGVGDGFEHLLHLEGLREGRGGAEFLGQLVAGNWISRGLDWVGVKGRGGGKTKAAPLVSHEEKRPLRAGDGGVGESTGCNWRKCVGMFAARGDWSGLLANLTMRRGNAPPDSPSRGESSSSVRRVGLARTFAPLRLERSGRENGLEPSKAGLAPRRQGAKGENSSGRHSACSTGPRRGRGNLTGFR